MTIETLASSPGPHGPSTRPSNFTNTNATVSTIRLAAANTTAEANEQSVAVA